MGFAFTADDLESLTRAQKVAIMESLIVALMSDGKTPKQEIEMFDLEVESIPWGLERPELISELTAARQRILALDSKEAGIELIKRAASLLDEQGLRDKVFRAMASIVRADREMNEKELGLLRGYATVFEIDAERLEQIKADVDERQP